MNFIGWKFLFCIFLSTIPSLSLQQKFEPPKYYLNYKVIEVFPKFENKQELVKTLENVVSDFWSEPFSSDEESFEILVSPRSERDVTKVLSFYGAAYKVVVKNLQEEIDRENQEEDENQIFDEDSLSLLYNNHHVSKRGIFNSLFSIFSDPPRRHTEPQVDPLAPNFRSPRKVAESDLIAVSPKVVKFEAPKMNWRSYHRLETIYQYMKDLEKNYPGLVETFDIGTSFEGRSIFMAKIGIKKKYEKPAIFIEGGIHAREWISPATVTFIMKSLVENHKKNSDLIDIYDFYILPVLNPDGYEYSHARDRMWRKSRSKSSLGNLFLLNNCVGVDLNRNFGFKWGGKGGLDFRSGNRLSCTETYSGPKPFSEPETRALSQFVLSIKHRLVMYLSFHSFGEKIIYPWSHTSRPIPDWEELHYVADKMAEAIYFETDGHDKYRVGSAPGVQYLATGGSDDWIRGVAGVKWVFLVELPDNGEHGFILPSSHIVPVAKSAFSAVRVAAKIVSKTLV